MTTTSRIGLELCASRIGWVRRSVEEVYEVKVEADFVCEHGMPQPWATCHECMFLPFDQRPVPPKPKPKPEPPKPKRVAKRKTATGSSTPKKPRRKAPPAPSQSLPRSVDDESPPLIGDRDLAYEIPSENLRHHVRGADKGWLPISTMPTELRHRGWVYLKTDDHLAACCRVRGIGYRDQRWTHERSGVTSDAGPGPTIELDGDWEFMSIDVEDKNPVEIRGYIYLATGDDGAVQPVRSAGAIDE